MKRHLLFTLCVAIAAPCLAQQKTQTRLKEKTTETKRYSPDGSTVTESSSTTYQYNYGKNGWLSTVTDNDGETTHEYELNAAGYMVKHVACSTSISGDKSYTKTERTLDENNKTIKEVIYRKEKYDTDYHKLYENLFEYDHTPNGKLIERRNYNNDGTLYFASIDFWAKDAGRYVGGYTSYNSSGAKMELEVDRANMSFCTKTYQKCSSDESKQFLQEVRHMSFGSDGNRRDNYFLYYDDQEVLIDADGTKAEIVYDPVTHLQTYTMNRPVVKDGALTFEMSEKRTDLTPTIILWELSGDAPKLAFIENNTISQDTYLTKMPDGTFAAEIYDEHDEDTKIFVFNSNYELTKTLRYNQKDTGYEWAYLQAGVFCLEEKDGDNWKPLTNSSCCTCVYGSVQKIITDEQGRVKERWFYNKQDGEEEYNVSNIYSFTYSPNGVNRLTYNDKNNPIEETDCVKDGNVNTTIRYSYENGVKVATLKEVIETVTKDNVTDINTSRYRYNSSYNKLLLDFVTQRTVLADGSYTATSYNVDSDGTKHPMYKSEGKIEDNYSYIYNYLWDNDLNAWSGTNGISTKKYSQKEFEFYSPTNNLEHFYDPSSSPEFGKQIINLTTCTKEYEWNKYEKEWSVVSTKGCNLSDDGRKMTSSSENQYGSQSDSYKIDAEGKLIEYISISTDKNNADFDRTSLDFYRYNFDGHLKLHTNDFTMNGTNVITKDTYTYGDVTTGINNAHVSATGLAIDGRTLSIDGAQLTLYNTAGLCVAQGKGSVTAPAPGVYVLKSGNTTWKMTLK